MLYVCYSHLYFQCEVCMNSDVQLCLMPARCESDTYLWHFPSPSHTHTDPDVHVFSSGSEVFWQGVTQLLPHTFSSRSVRVEEHTHTHTHESLPPCITVSHMSGTGGSGEGLLSSVATGDCLGLVITEPTTLLGHLVPYSISFSHRSKFWF